MKILESIGSFLGLSGSPSRPIQSASSENPDNELIKEFCSVVLNRIKKDSIGLNVRYYTLNLQSFVIKKGLSNEVYTLCKKCLLELWKYSKEKKYINDDVIFEDFCRCNVSIFDTKSIDQCYTKNI